MEDLSELYRNMPQKDCGACGNSTCGTMARRLGVGEQKIEECVYLQIDEFREQKKNIEKILTKGVRMQGVESKKAGMALITPCIVDAKKFQAEVQLQNMGSKYGFLDSVLLCSFLESCEKFEEVKCSPKLGIARINYDKKEILLSPNGRVVIKLAKDEEDALQTADLISKVLWGCIICPLCGNPVIECVSGGCGTCTDFCPILLNNPFNLGEQKIKKRNNSTIVTEVDYTRKHCILDECIDLLDLLHGIFEENFTRLWMGKMIDLSKAEEIRGKIQKKVLEFLIGSEIENAFLGLVLLGSAQHLFIMNMAVRDAHKYHFDGLELIEEIKNFTKIAFRFFGETNQENASTLDNKYRRIGKKILKRNSHYLEFFRLLSNAYYISRVPLIREVRDRLK